LFGGVEQTTGGVQPPTPPAIQTLREADMLSTQPIILAESTNSLRANDLSSVHEDSCDVTELEHRTDVGISTGRTTDSCRSDGIDQVEGP
jgi:hypothetical protein